MKQGLEKLLAKKWMIFLLFLSLTYLFGTKTDRRYGWTNAHAKEATPIYSDGAGYYSFLPEWFIYEGSNFEFSDSIGKKYPNAGFEDNLIPLEGEKKINKYFTGTAQCLTPFFLIGHIHAKAVGEDTDGYSWPYLLWLNAGMIAFGMIGLIALFFFLRRLKMDFFACYLSVILLAIATNLCFYVYYEIPYSHVFSFATINLCLFFGLKWKQEHKKGSLLLFAFFLGLAVMVRPTNILILLIFPFLFSSNKELINHLRNLFKKEWKLLFFALLLFGIPLIIQLWSTYVQMGKIQLSSYSDEGFTNWKDPYMWQILFGFRKGVFVYNPVLLLLIPGLVMMYIQSKRLLLGFLIFGLVVTYVLSAWWCWWYGGSLGFRPMIDFYGVLAIPIAFLIHYLSGFWRVFVFVFIVFSTYVYQTYEFQFKKNIIHYDYMNYPMWKKVFLNEDPRLSFMFYSKIDTLSKESEPITSPFSFSIKGKPLQANKIYGGSTSLVYPNTIDFGKKMKVRDSNSFVGLQVSMDIFLNEPGENVNFVANYFKNDSVIGKSDVIVSSRPYKIKRWEHIEVDATPNHRWKEIDSVQCLFILGGKTTRFKNLKIQFFKSE